MKESRNGQHSWPDLDSTGEAWNTMTSADLHHILDAGYDLDAKGINGRTALMNAITECDRPGIAPALIEAGVDIHATDTRGMNALMLACNYRRYATVEALLAVGGVVHETDDRGWTALHHAAEGGSPESVNALLVRRPNVDAQNRRHLTALHYAAMYGEYAVARLLVEAGADTSIRDDQGKRPIDYLTAEKPPSETAAWKRLLER